MAKYDRKKKKSFPVTLLSCIVAVLFAVLIWLLVTRGGEPAPDGTEATVETTLPAETAGTVPTTEPQPKELLVIESIENQGDMVVITTSCAVLKYPFAFSDLIRVEATNTDSRSSLTFSLAMGESVYPLYALHFGGSEGMLLGSVTLEDGSPVSVFGEFAQIPESLTEADAVTYYAVQETFNDIVASLGENPQFTPAA